jgi:SAM-dependent methyltransferase
MTMVETSVALRLIQGRPWHHEFEIVPGVRTQGTYDPLPIWSELQLPEDLRGTSLADVGASNGYFSFEARRRGARVAAFDFKHKDNSGFGLAQYINGLSDIEHHHVNVLDMKVETYGQFDVVLALGLLYHVSDPYLALSNCAAMARKRLLIESYCADASLPEAMRSRPIMTFISDPVRFPGHHLNADRTNFWGFTSACLHCMLEDLGFAALRTNVRGDRVFIDAVRSDADEKDTRLSIAYGVRPAVPAGPDLDDQNAWQLF